MPIRVVRIGVVHAVRVVHVRETRSGSRAEVA